jgi:hypothetical protein
MKFVSGKVRVRHESLAEFCIFTFDFDDPTKKSLRLIFLLFLWMMRFSLWVRRVDDDQIWVDKVAEIIGLQLVFQKIPFKTSDR